MLGGARIAAILALSGALAATSASARSVPSSPYTAGATAACLASLPHGIVGLPPATPPKPPALFVHRFARERVPRTAHGQLGAWYGQQHAYSGIIISFFRTAQEARAAVRTGSLFWFRLYGGKLIRNAAVAWAQESVPARTLQRTVLNCLRPGRGVAEPHRAIPQARLATYAGYWGGHTRRLNIEPNGEGFENVNSGCCIHVITMSFRLLRVTGTVTDATATFRVTAVRHGEWPRNRSRPRVGQVGRLVLKNGVVTDTLTDIYYCSDPAWGATGACGA